MSANDDIISGFSNDDNEMAFVIDFRSAKRLDRTGTTCDTYECTVQHRHLFVKRLKPEYRDNPLYRAAFKKEYELGVRLTHASLPRYVGYGEDYIVMDYIEGDTLADMIRRGDIRLKGKKYVRQLLTELVDVVTYLHRSRVVHCDIKPDNVIISPHPDRPLTLIDLDKAYSPWWETTHGDAVKYGCKECADGEIDFRGIGLIAAKLGLNRIAYLCRKENITADDIYRGLRPQRNLYLFLAIISIVIAAITVVVISRKDTAPSHVAATFEETINSDTPHVIEVSPQAVTVQPHNIDTEGNLTSKAADTADRSLEDIVRMHYTPLYKRHEYLRTLIADSTTSSEMVTYAYRQYADQQMKAQADIYADIMDKYSLSDAFEASAIAGSSREWKRFMTADYEINNMVTEAISKREANLLSQ